MTDIYIIHTYIHIHTYIYIYKRRGGEPLTDHHTQTLPNPSNSVVFYCVRSGPGSCIWVLRRPKIALPRGWRAGGSARFPCTGQKNPPVTHKTARQNTASTIWIDDECIVIRMWGVRRVARGSRLAKRYVNTAYLLHNCVRRVEQPTVIVCVFIGLELQPCLDQPDGVCCECADAPCFRSGKKMVRCYACVAWELRSSRIICRYE